MLQTTSRSYCVWPSALRSAAVSAVTSDIRTEPSDARAWPLPGCWPPLHWAGHWIITGGNFHTKHNLWGARGGAGYRWPGYSGQTWYRAFTAADTWCLMGGVHMFISDYVLVETKWSNRVLKVEGEWNTNPMFNATLTEIWTMLLTTAINSWGLWVTLGRRKI